MELKKKVHDGPCFLAKIHLGPEGPLVEGRGKGPKGLDIPTRTLPTTVLDSSKRSSQGACSDGINRLTRSQVLSGKCPPTRRYHLPAVGMCVNEKINHNNEKF